MSVSEIALCDYSIFDRFGQLRGKVDSHTNANRDPDANSETHCDTNTNRDPDANTNRDPDANRHARANGEPYSDSDTDRELHPLSAPAGLWSYILEHKFA